MMKIWVDADACPVVIKEILFKAANRTKIHTTLLANHNMSVLKSPYIHFSQVSQGFDVADNEIVERCQVGDLVITSDIPLASDIIDKGGLALSSRGEVFSKENIKSLLSMRDFMDTMRSSGEHTGGPAPMNQADRQQFAAQLDKILTRHLQSQPKS
ncbi:YaiI/YqxD family protein [Oceaniserpentilla sp. 4NH20-0058]